MSITTDALFIRAIRSDKSLMKLISNRLYGTAIPAPKDKADNTPVPYIIVMFDGMRNSTFNKDTYELEGDEDITTISLELTAPTLEKLHQLASLTRSVICDFMAHPEAGDKDWDEFPSAYDLSASAISYDSAKPCYWQTLTYECTTNRNTDNGSN